MPSSPAETRAIDTKHAEDPEALADAIRKISRATEKLTRSGLNREAICVLLVHSTKLSRRAIDRVLDDLASLERRYTIRKAGE